MSSYSELLKDPRWQKQRLEIFQRDNWTCQKCFDTLSSLQIHHIYYLPNTKPWEYPNEALITLCDLCHTKAEFSKWMLRSGNEALLGLGLTDNDRRDVTGMILRRVKENHYRQDVLRYMDDIKRQLNG